MMKMCVKYALIFFFLILSPAGTCDDSIFREVEELASQSRTPLAFFRRPQNRDKYYEAIKRLYGLSTEDLPRENFDAIVRTIQSLCRRSPEFAQAIWNNKEPLGFPHKVTALESTDLNSIDRVALVTYWTDYQKSSLKFINRHFPNFKINEINWEVIASLEEQSIKIEQFQLSVSHLSRKKQNTKMSAFFKDIKASSRVKASVLALGLYLFLQKGFPQSIDSITASELISILSQTEITNELSNRKLDSFQQIRSHFLPTQSTLQQRNIFVAQFDPWLRGTLSEGDYHFVPFPRSVHTFFKGACHNECTGGGRDYLEAMTAARLATAALKGTHFYMLVNKKKPLGWAQLVSIQNKESGDIALNFESGSTVFNQHIVVAESHSQKVSFVSAWVNVFYAENPATQRLVIGQSDEIRNSGSLPFVRDSLASRFAGYSGDHSEYTYFDLGFPQFITANSPILNTHDLDVQVDFDSEHMMLDSTARKAGRLRELLALDFEIFQNLSQLKELYAGADPEWRLLYFSQFIQLDVEDENFEKWIKKLWNSYSAKDRQNIILRISQDAQRGILRPTPIVKKLLLKSQKQMLNIFRFIEALPIPNNFAATIRHFSRHLQSQHLPISFYKKLSDNVDSYSGDLEIIKVLVSRGQGVKDFLFAISLAENIKSSSLIEQINKVLMDNIDRFFTRNPSNSDIKKLDTFIYSIIDSIEIRTHAINRAIDPQQLILYSKSNIENPNDKYKSELDQLLIRFAPRLLKMNPTLKEFIQFASLAHSVETAATIIELYIPRLKTLRDWKKLMYPYYPKGNYEEAAQSMAEQYEHIRLLLLNRRYLPRFCYDTLKTN